MINLDAPTRRRRFVGRIAALAASMAGVGVLRAVTPLRAADLSHKTAAAPDDAWLDKLTGKQKTTFDVDKVGRAAMSLMVVLGAVSIAGCQNGDRGGSPPASDSTSKSAEMGTSVAAALSGPLDYTPPPDSAIPNDQLGASIKRGQALIVHTTDSLPKYATGSLQCSSSSNHRNKSNNNS